MLSLIFVLHTQGETLLYCELKPYIENPWEVWILVTELFVVVYSFQ